MAIREVFALITNLAGAQTSATFISTVGGTYQLAAVATWGGASLQLQQLMPDGTTWFAIGTAVTANGLQFIDVPSGAKLRAVITGAGGTAQYASLSSVKQ